MSELLKNKNILISGSSGFIGKNLIAYLTEVGNYNLEYVNLRNLDLWSINLSNIDVIIHLAGKAHDLNGSDDISNYYSINFELTKKMFDLFLASPSKIFIFISSVKAVADNIDRLLTEEIIPNPETHYGKSKLMAENYISGHFLPQNKSFYILRPCMIHGPGNKGNLNILYKVVSKNIPWPLGAFENKRSFCSIDNLMFIFKELIEGEGIPSGTYNIADDEPLSTIELIGLIAQSQNRKPKVWRIPIGLIEWLASLGDKLHFPLSLERLNKLTSSYIVSNVKIKIAIGKQLPVSSRDGLLKTFESFSRK